MSSWQAQHAKTGNGREQAVLLSAEDDPAALAHKLDFRAFLLGGPRVDDFEIERDRDTGRDVLL